MTGDDEIVPSLDAAYAVENPDDNRKLYANWADTYESDFIAESRYVYHRHVAEIFAGGFADLGSPVLDVGCGTGVVGQQLRALGVEVIDGIDISPEMLSKARAKTDGKGRVYRDLIEADLTGSIDIDSDRYAGIISAGTFTHGHLGPEALLEILRVARPGARCTIGINASHFEQRGFRDWLDRRADEAAIGPYEIIDAIIYIDADEDNLDQVARVAVFDRGSRPSPAD